MFSSARLFTVWTPHMVIMCLCKRFWIEDRQSGEKKAQGVALYGHKLSGFVWTLA